MKIIALDSSGQVASVATVVDGVLTGEYSTNYKKTHSQTLLPMLDELLQMTELELEEVDAVAISAGPGSFTGLRIGAATAKGLGLALKKPIVAVPTLEALAYNFYGYNQVICPMMDARREQVYSGIYIFERIGKHPFQYELQKKKDGCAIDVHELLENINQIGQEVIFLGDGSAVYKETIMAQCNVAFSFAPFSMNVQRAASVALLAGQMFEKGQIQTAAFHAPEYFRVSQAEREREEKNT